MSPFERSRRKVVKAGVLSPFLLAACQPKHDISGGFVGANHERGHLLREAVNTSSTIPKITRTVHTLIVGGGVAGLSAARALRLQGIDDFAVLELEDEAGGNARAGHMAGMAHPLGAHYLPVPSDAAPETQDLLEELGLRMRVSGRWQYDERHLCHSPQERLYIHGAWQEGLLPHADVGSATWAQYTQFSQLVERWRATGGFQIPHAATPQALHNMAKLAMPFAAYLDSQGLTDAYLRWYLDYCCRDDYGAGLEVVSAWAGIHYFAARHGFTASGGKIASQQDLRQQGGVLTWPEGNAFLTRALSKPLGQRLHTGRLVQRIAQEKSGIHVDALNVKTNALERWQAQHCIVALPIFIAARVLENPPDFLRQAAQHTAYASWSVANVHINAALLETKGEQGGVDAAWDNVIFNPATATAPSTGGLGYVDAMHQSTRIAPGPSVLSFYRAWGVGADARRSLLERSWAQQRDQTLADLALAHSDIWQRAVQVNITRYGHAMAVPTPEFLKEIGLKSASKMSATLSRHGQARLAYAPRHVPRTPRLRFAHSDWSGYSVFEEAFTRGLHAGLMA